MGYVYFKKSFTFWSLELIYSCIAVLFAAIIALSFFNYHLSHYLKRLFEIKLLVWLGKFSYGIYIYHYPIFLTFLSFLLPHLTYYFGVGLFAKAMNGLISLFVTFIISYLSFMWLEKPFLNLKNRFAR